MKVNVGNCDNGKGSAKFWLGECLKEVMPDSDAREIAYKKYSLEMDKVLERAAQDAFDEGRKFQAINSKLNVKGDKNED